MRPILILTKSDKEEEDGYTEDDEDNAIDVEIETN